MYGTRKAESVFAHQLWAACSLYQVTEEKRYWTMTEEIYRNLVVITKPSEQAQRITNMYFPVANYDNPIFYGLMCMAQSAPEATGLDDRWALAPCRHAACACCRQAAGAAAVLRARTPAQGCGATPRRCVHACRAVPARVVLLPWQRASSPRRADAGASAHRCIARAAESQPRSLSVRLTGPVPYGVWSLTRPVPKPPHLVHRRAAHCRQEFDFDNEDEAEQLVNNADLWEVGSRLEVTNNLRRFFVSPWLVADGSLPGAQAQRGAPAAVPLTCAPPQPGLPR